MEPARLKFKLAEGELRSPTAFLRRELVKITKNVLEGRFVFSSSIVLRLFFIIMGFFFLRCPPPGGQEEKKLLGKNFRESAENSAFLLKIKIPPPKNNGQAEPTKKNLPNLYLQKLLKIYIYF
jgi:hypothetical protein